MHVVTPGHSADPLCGLSDRSSCARNPTQAYSQFSSHYLTEVTVSQDGGSETVQAHWNWQLINLEANSPA
jgi:hypothetical protein